MCNRVRWHNSFSPLPHTHHQNFSAGRREAEVDIANFNMIIIKFCVQDNEIHPRDELYSERKLLRWETEFTLAHFDREVNAFEENICTESDFSDEPSLCLDDSNEGSLYSEVNIIIARLLPSILYFS